MTRQEALAVVMRSMDYGGTLNSDAVRTVEQAHKLLRSTSPNNYDKNEEEESK